MLARGSDIYNYHTAIFKILKMLSVIAEQMKERMSGGGGDKKSEKAKIGYDQMNHPDFKNTTKRKELAKIAGQTKGIT